MGKVWEEECSTWNNFREASGRRGGNQKTTLREKEEKGKFKTAVASRKPAIYGKIPNRISAGGFQRGICREPAGRGKPGTVPAQGVLPGRAGSGSAGLGWEGLAAAGKGWKVGKGYVEFAVWNSRVSVVPCGKVPEGETCKDIETPHRADGSCPGRFRYGTGHFGLVNGNKNKQ